MAPIKIERLVSVSSEDEAHPAVNLLKIDYTDKKWKCKDPGEKQISVVFQLAQFCKIFSVDVGNEHSAFIEILVGKSCSPDDDFKVLLVTSSLMTLQEAKFGTNVNGVNFFKEEHFCKPVCEEKWDRVKIVCTQPFNKHVQYGLSFIVFHAETSQSTNASPVGNCQLKASVEPLLKAGGLFANRNHLTNRTLVTGAAAAIRAASVSVDAKLDSPCSTFRKGGNSSNSPKIDKDDEGKKKKQDEGKTPNKKNVVNGNTTPAVTSKKLPNDVPHRSPRKKVLRATVQPFKKREERPFGSLMSGVVFSISGYENPLRSELRSKAMAMGARYEANWNCNCTHLICAFRNTPKYCQVRGSGKIVKKEWVEECYSRRARLPWRRYALDRNDASQAESEGEIYELIEKPLPAKRSACTDSTEEDGDTDDEIEKVRQKQKRLSENNLATPSTSGVSLSSNSTSSNSGGDKNKFSTEETENKINDTVVPKVAEKIKVDVSNHDEEVKKENGKQEHKNIYEMDTESEDENHWEKNKSGENTLPPLPAFFHGATIALLDDLTASDRKLLTRYIKAHQGAIADDNTDLNTILYAITEDISAIERVKEDFPQVIGVTPEWIWRSHDEAKLLPASLFKVK